MVDRLGIDTIFIFCEAGGVVGTDDMLDLYEIKVSFLGVPKGPKYQKLARIADKIHGNNTNLTQRWMSPG